MEESANRDDAPTTHGVTDGWSRKELRKRTTFAKAERPLIWILSKISSATISIRLRECFLPTLFVSSVSNFAERFFGGIDRVTGNQCDENGRSDVHRVRPHMRTPTRS